MLKKEMLIALLALLGVQGAGLAHTSVYSPPDGEYQLRYPSRWRAITNARELEIMRRDIGLMMPELKMEQTPDAFFISGMTMASVSRFRLPAELLDGDIDTYIDAMMDQYVGEDMRRQQIGEHVFVVHTGNMFGRSHFYYASTIHEGEVISLRFAGNRSMTDDERAIYEGVVASLRLKDSGEASVVVSDDPQTEKEMSPPPTGRPSGFWTGLWHGMLILPRWIVSWFTSVRVYANPNTGFGYLAGFVIGIVMFLKVVGNSKR